MCSVRIHVVHTHAHTHTHTHTTLQFVVSGMVLLLVFPFSLFTGLCLPHLVKGPNCQLLVVELVCSPNPALPGWGGGGHCVGGEVC